MIVNIIGWYALVSACISFAGALASIPDIENKSDEFKKRVQKVWIIHFLSLIVIILAWK